MDLPDPRQPETVGPAAQARADAGDSLMSQKSSRPQLIYVGGYGRSGTTLLDAMLGNHPEILGVGQLANLFRDACNRANCVCGVALPECPLWGRVLDRVFRECPWLDCSKAAALTARVESLKKWGGDRDAYIRLWQATFEAIIAASGKSVIVDSSKISAAVWYRLPLLTRGLGIPVKIVHLVRDPRAVMWSVSRGPAIATQAGGKRAEYAAMARTSLLWTIANAYMERLRRRNPAQRVLRVRYEDYVCRPDDSMKELGCFLDVSLQGLLDRVHRGDAFSAGHAVAGNVRRNIGPMTVKFDDEWQREMPRLGRTMALIAWPLMRKYAYT